MQDALVEHLSSPVPRYTSYPTAPHFNYGVGAQVYAGWLAALTARNRLSLYAHIPYCDRLCWFCACHTKQTLRYEPVEAYLRGLYAEIAAIGARVDRAAPVTALHFGGGSPTLLKPDDMRALKACLDANFTFADDAEIACLLVDRRRVSVVRRRAVHGCERRAGVGRRLLGVAGSRVLEGIEGVLGQRRLPGQACKRNPRGDEP